MVVTGPSGLKRRLFLAVPLADEARAILAQALPRLPGKAVPPENWHLTTRFLGWVDQVTEERVVAGVDQANLGSPFDVVLGAMAAFPRPVRATVLWLGVDQGFVRLAELNEICEEVAEAAGLSPEDRPYTAHLTLSRIRPHQDVGSVVEKHQPLPLRWTADRLVLYESKLDRAGAVYTPVEEFPFKFGNG